MGKVTGIGGVFVRAADPAALATWYTSALGIGFNAGESYAIIRETAADSYCVVATFGPNDDYIGDPARQSVMVNFRVDDLDGVIARLSDVGSAAEPVVEEENGRFSWTTDPEGNRIELWEPPATS